MCPIPSPAHHRLGWPSNDNGAKRPRMWGRSRPLLMPNTAMGVLPLCLPDDGTIASSHVSAGECSNCQVHTRVRHLRSGSTRDLHKMLKSGGAFGHYSISGKPTCLARPVWYSCPSNGFEVRGGRRAAVADGSAGAENPGRQRALLTAASLMLPSIGLHHWLHRLPLPIQ
jgi:hypothetical protein